MSDYQHRKEDSAPWSYLESIAKLADHGAFYAKQKTNISAFTEDISSQNVIYYSGEIDTYAARIRWMM
jgi:hypothetical protein